RSPAHRLARLSGSGLGRAKEALATAEAMDQLPQLEADRRQPWSDNTITGPENMDGPCGFHHDLTTYKGWVMVEGVGKRPMVPPDDPRHPANVQKAQAGMTG
ncbi:MAG: hypothetical protein ACRD0N_16070, partial [Acidimicrobiales bacterium]